MENERASSTLFTCKQHKPEEGSLTRIAVSENHCILLNIPLTDVVDSYAHVIPSALGGRLKPPM